MTRESYLSDHLLAERYAVHPKTIWAWARQGRFPHPIKLQPGCTRWRASDVEAWEAEQAREAVTE